MITNIATLTWPRALSGAIGRLCLCGTHVGDQPGVTASRYDRGVPLDHVFHQALGPLIIVSAVFTAAIFPLVPLLIAPEVEKESRHALVGEPRMPAPTDAVSTSGTDDTNSGRTYHGF